MKISILGFAVVKHTVTIAWIVAMDANTKNITVATWEPFICHGILFLKQKYFDFINTKRYKSLH